MSYNEEDKTREEEKNLINKVEEIDDNSEVEEENSEDRNIKEKAYDKLPFTYKQVDIFTKLLIGVFVILIIYLIVTSNRMPWN